MSKQFVIIELDKPRNLRLNMGGVTEFEELTGTKVKDLTGDSPNKVICQMLWIMLKADDKELEYETAVELINYAKSILYVYDKLGETIELAYGTGEEKKAEKPSPNEKTTKK